MVKLVSAGPEAAGDDMVLEVDRVEDARTVTELFLIPATHWQELLRTEVQGGRPDSAEEAYRTLKEFWDGLATAFADLPPDVPVSPGPGWLAARYHDWQDRTKRRSEACPGA